MKILHIIPDDKFWSAIVTLFDKVDVRNEYVHIINDTAIKTQFVDSEIVDVIPKDRVGFLWERDDIDIVLFHSIPYSYYDFILSINITKTVIVFSWGYDLYYSQNGCPPLLPLRLFKPKTQRLLNRIENSGSVFIRVKRIIKKFFSRKERERKRAYQHMVEDCMIKQQAALKRVDYWATVLPNEYEMLVSTIGITSQFFPLHYAIRSLKSNLPVINLDIANDILVGNSADSTNNHLDLFRLLKKRGIRNKLFIPLAYGQRDYCKAVREYCQAKAIECDILDRLVPREEYTIKLLTCRAAVFGHIRQQAIGNINICLLQGIKVFLFKESVAYTFFKSTGSFVYSIEDDLTQEEIAKPLTREQIRINREKLEWLTVEHVISQLNQSLREIECNYSGTSVYTQDRGI